MEKENKYVQHSALKWSAEDVERMIQMHELNITLSEDEMLDVINDAVEGVSDMLCEMINENIYNILCQKLEEKK